MEIRSIAGVLGLMALLSACAEHPTPTAAPAAIPDNAEQSAPVVTEPAPAAPAAAPAPQGLEQPKSAESAAQDDELSTLEGAEHALDRAKNDLDRLALADASAKLGRAAPTGGAAKPKKEDTQRTGAPSAADAATSTPRAAVCGNACRAFASLSRAANAVCRLDGDNGKHCTRAKRMVADAEPRVAACACLAAD
jgi:hypothetical protein